VVGPNPLATGWLSLLVLAGQFGMGRCDQPLPGGGWPVSDGTARCRAALSVHPQVQ
jgi:hypothetical protein